MNAWGRSRVLGTMGELLSQMAEGQPGMPSCASLIPLERKSAVLWEPGRKRKEKVVAG